MPSLADLEAGLLGDVGQLESLVPDPWTYEHEAEVPECFRDPSAVTPRAQPPHWAANLT